MKVIFADFDGVLNSTQWFFKQDRDGNYGIDDFCPIACSNLMRILEEVPNTRIVVSSSWRHGRSVEELRNILQKNGIVSEYVIDKTPDLKGQIRGKEIAAWLESYKGFEKIEEFVIIDDDEDMGILKKHLVKTDGYEGLMWSKMKKVMKMLGHTKET
jgi:hypothetical protein